MTDDQRDLRALLKADIEARRVGLGRHPDPEELDALQEGALTPEEAKRLRDHVLLCPECTEFVLSLGEFRGLDVPAEEEVPAEELNEAWQKLHAMIHKETPALKVQPSPARISWIRLLAAVLALAVVGLLLWSFSLYRTNLRLGEQTRSNREAVSTLSTRFEQERRRSASLAARTKEQSRQIAELRQSLKELLRPRINTLVLDLSPRRTRGTGPADIVPEIPRDADVITLILEPEEHRIYPAYAVEILDSGGRTLWTLEGLSRTEFGNFTVTLARRTLPGGEIRLRLYGGRGSRRVEIGAYALSIAEE